jgi:hypothetical protein
VCLSNEARFLTRSTLPPYPIAIIASDSFEDSRLQAMCRTKALLFFYCGLGSFATKLTLLLLVRCDEPVQIDAERREPNRTSYESPHSRPYTSLLFLCTSEVKELLAENRPQSAELCPSPKNLGKERMPTIWGAKYFSICEIVLL